MDKKMPVFSRICLLATVALGLAGMCPSLSLAEEKAVGKSDERGLPKVVLIGDSIRLSYAPVVTKNLQGKARVVSPAANGGDSSNVLKHLDAWVIKEQPQIVHFNCGIHDTKKFKQTGKFQVSPEEYEKNLRTIIERIRKETGAVVLFATTTPIVDERAAATRADRDYELREASVEQYNAIARRVMADLKVPVDDLHSLLHKEDEPLADSKLIVGDGVHLTPAGQKLLGDAVTDFVSPYVAQPK